MPSKYYIRNFVKSDYYHIFNRGANKNSIFFNKNDYKVFTDILSYYLIHPHGIAPSRLEQFIKSETKKKRQNKSEISTSSIHLVCYCLMSNHFHLLIKQVNEPDSDGGVTNLMRRLSITYSLYLNKSRNKTGTIYEGKYKNVTIISENQLIHLSKYIHNNPSEIKSSLPLEDYPYSSYPEYISNVKTHDWLHSDYILDIMYKTNQHQKYKDFVEEKEMNNNIIKHLQIEK